MRRGDSPLEPAGVAIDRATGGALSRLLRSGDFEAKPFETAVLYPGKGSSARVIAVGVGAPEEVARHRLRQAVAQGIRRARDLRAKSVAIATPRGSEDAAARTVQAMAEGVVLGHHRFTVYRSRTPAPPLERVEFVSPSGARAKKLRDAVARGARWGEAVCLARDLAGTPGSDLGPEQLAERAAAVAQACGARIQVLGPEPMERLGMGALLAVGRGSARPPRFVVLERDPGDSRRRGRGRDGARRKVRTVVLVGKGITFDAGGLSLKPAADMHRMKYDMAGAAAVLGIFSALPTLSLPFRVVGLLPVAENLPDGDAMRPGDVLRAMDGTTIEVINTDAEGRLILADALSYARRYEPLAVVDLATLTGAITIALGPHAAGLFSADDGLAGELAKAGEAAGERLWRMPLFDDYRASLNSDTADLVNSAGREGGAILAATFLRHFAGGMRWAHLDIAGTAWATSDRPHESRGPTGFGVRLLLEWLSGLGSRPVASRPRASRAR